ncbi:hypothetical protein LCGC14_1645320 [marine sediment metagenome]|uniref:Uncharacterized protein n=1 Tax=marine sediment metagenome TaxID=412755 RepID=A0A0F9HYE1_9ZZZZ
MNEQQEKLAKYTEGGILNWSWYSRENIPKPPPLLAVGDKVRFTLETIIENVGQDCDGTVLYSAESIGFGWGEESFEKLP